MRYALPIPFGWYCIGLSCELAPGEVKPLHYFGEQLVLFRTEAGQARLLDAYCPHLGAHLGWGGTVRGEHIACPFHGWEFSGQGRCMAIPYAQRIPPRARDRSVLRPYPLVEANGLLYAWYHPRAIDPLFQPERLPELDSPAWTELEVYTWEIACVLQETGENAVDTAHFLTVHGAATQPRGVITVEGHRRVTDVTMLTRGMDPATGKMDEREEAQVEGHLVTRNIGPGQSIQIFDTFFHTLMIGTITPIDSQRLQLRFCFSQPRAATPAQQIVARGVIDDVVAQVAQDIPIWEHKQYRENPLLCDGDGPIGPYRRWFSQFYDRGPEFDTDCA